VAEVLEHVWPLVEAGRVTPVIDRVLPMGDAAVAHRVIEAGARGRESPARNLGTVTTRLS
jgi:NADPH:quinone reductase-like Zn-dependent oxidoreductase